VLLLSETGRLQLGRRLGNVAILEFITGSGNDQTTHEAEPLSFTLNGRTHLHYNV